MATYNLNGHKDCRVAKEMAEVSKQLCEKMSKIYLLIT